MATFTFKPDRYDSLIFRIQRWFCGRAYDKASRIVLKRAKESPTQNIFCISAMGGRLLWHFYRAD